MREYLSTIHSRSEAHKKKFAFIVSGCITLIIFIIWSFIRFNEFTNPSKAPEVSNSAELTPISNITDGIANSLSAFKSTVTELKGAVRQADLQKQYEEMRNEALPTDEQNVNMGNTINNGQ